MAARRQAATATALLAGADHAVFDSSKQTSEIVESVLELLATYRGKNTGHAAERLGKINKMLTAAALSDAILDKDSDRISSIVTAETQKQLILFATKLAVKRVVGPGAVKKVLPGVGAALTLREAIQLINEVADAREQFLETLQVREAIAKDDLEQQTALVGNRLARIEETLEQARKRIRQK